MPIKGKKSLPIDEDTHKRIALESVQTGKDMYALIVEAWECYEKLKASPGGVTTADSKPPQTIESSTGSHNKSNKLHLDSVTIAAGEKQAESWENYGEAHAALDYILSRGPRGMAEDILGNIRWFEFAARVASGDAAPGEVPQLAAAIDSIESGVERARAIKREHLRSTSDSQSVKDRKGQGKNKIG